jgi:hypothetical protein
MMNAFDGPGKQPRRKSGPKYLRHERAHRKIWKIADAVFCCGTAMRRTALRPVAQSENRAAVHAYSFASSLAKSGLSRENT